MGVTAFPPVIDDDSRVLVLGSMPGVQSLAKQQYYGHPRNHFWPLLYGLYGLQPDEAYESRLAFARGQGVALWDVLARCEREGSLDADITAPEANDFAALLGRYPRVAAIFFNGSKAEQLFRRLVVPTCAAAAAKLPALHLLPSSSPARTLTLPRKLLDWQQVRRTLEMHR
ncbi:DNA-deoxyinosine glycosylase [Paenibacillus cymbidii]|uniref:DNA-deoxyinosine glycosylase n=1 Tax=Paenibacillus cymbidii TaxID=1639034 RepID=UPI001F379B2A|nr:DNA-deoxyinosine glycosylase [Paenibacillus cymbidii]